MRKKGTKVQYRQPYKNNLLTIETEFFLITKALHGNGKADLSSVATGQVRKHFSPRSGN